MLLISLIIRVYGTPRAIRSDHASVFVSKAITALYAKFGIKIEASTAYHHRTVGLVERWHSTLRSILLSHRLSSGDERWHTYLPLLELSFNASVNTALGYSPFFIIHGRHPILPQDLLTTPPRDDPRFSELPTWVADHLERLHVTYDAVATKLRVNALHGKLTMDLRHDVTVSFKPGDRVLLLKGSVVDKNHPKAEEPYLGPFTVLRALPRDRYQLVDMHTRRMNDVVHVDRLKLFLSTPHGKEEDPDYYAVQSIVGHKFAVPKDRVHDSEERSATLQYRIRWRGFKSNSDSWRSVDSLTAIYPLVSQYNASLKFRHGLDLVKEHPDLFQSRDKFDTPPVSDAALQRKHFLFSPQHLASSAANPPKEPSPVFSTALPHSRFVEDVRVRVFSTGFGGDRWWVGTIVKKVVSFDGLDCKLSIRFDDNRLTRPYIYKYSVFGTSIELVAAVLVPSGSTVVPETVEAPPELSVESLPELSAASIPPPIAGKIDKAGRQLRARK